MECHEVVVWRLNLEVEDSSAYQDVLNAAEIARSLKLRLARKRHAFITTRGVLRLLLSEWLNIPAQNLVFVLGQHGKPSLIPAQNILNIHFNVSHSGKYALIALAVGTEIGVDVEEIQTRRDLIGLAETVFCDIELQAFLRLSANEQRTAFYVAWTRKEALLKALGKGLSMPLKDFAVSFDEENTEILWHAPGMEDLQAYRFHTITMPYPEYRAALATTTTSASTMVTIHDWMDAR